MSAPTISRNGHKAPAPHVCGAVAGHNSLDSHSGGETQSRHAAEGPNPPDPTSEMSTPMSRASGPAPEQPRPARDAATSLHPTTAGAQSQPGPVMAVTLPKDAAPVLADPLLGFAAEILDDIERVRIANENRLRQLTRAEEDSDGEDRGFGLPREHPDVFRLTLMVASMNCKSGVAADLGWERPPKQRGQRCCQEHAAEEYLTNLLKRNPLYPWAKQARGVGDKQAARLLGAIGDPYWNTLHDRPRLVSELWSYCGYGDAERQVRRRGVKANWSDTAKMRTFNVAESTLKQLVKPCYVVKRKNGKKEEYDYAVHLDGCQCSPYRVIYDLGRDRYRDTVHPRECARCGPKGHPAPAGSPRSAKHQHNAAIRLVSKRLLRDLWAEAKRLHELPGSHDHGGNQAASAAGEPTSPREDT